MPVFILQKPRLNDFIQHNHVKFLIFHDQVLTFAI